MEVRFSTAEARGLSLQFGFFLLLSLSLRVRASGTRLHAEEILQSFKFFSYE